MSSGYERNFCGLFLLLQGLSLAALPQVLGPTPWHWDQAQLPGFLPAPYDGASGPTLSLKWKPIAPLQGHQESVHGLAAHIAHHVFQCPGQCYLHKGPGTGSGESSPLAWGSLRRTFWKEPKVYRDLGLGGKDTSMMKNFFCFLKIQSYLRLKGGCERWFP